MTWLAPFISALVTLIVVVDPFGLAPIFLATTHGFSSRQRNRAGARACVIAAAILTGAALGGARLLDLLGVGLPAFRIAGGLLLFSIASEMVFGVRIERESRSAAQAVEERAKDVAAFPLAIPLMAGPGAITATLLLAGEAGGDPLRLAMLGAAIVVVMVMCFLAFRLAAQVERLIGASGNVVLAKLLGVIVASLAVQFVVDGVRALMAAG